MQHKSYIVFQAYGNQGILLECAFALLTLTKQEEPNFLANLEIWIYTDNPGFFKALNNCPLKLHFRTISPDLILKWRGKIDFVHRIKIEILKEFTSLNKGNILYLDTDTYIYQPLKKLFENINQGQIYMHIMEGVVNDSNHVMLKKLSRFLNKNQPLHLPSGKIEIHNNVAMWNAGVLGFHSDYAFLLDEILTFTDELYIKFHKHIVEQFAFSYYFQKSQTLKTAHTHIYHYWNLKEIRSILASFFQYFKHYDWQDMAKVSALIQLAEPMQQKVNFLQNRTSFEKARKLAWQPEDPKWELLLKQI